MNGVKPGWKTTQFWFHVGAVLLMAALAFLLKSGDTAGFPAILSMGMKLLIPPVIGYLAKHYDDNRTELYKVDAIANGKAAQAETPALAPGVGV